MFSTKEFIYFLLSVFFNHLPRTKPQSLSFFLSRSFYPLAHPIFSSPPTPNLLQKKPQPLHLAIISTLLAGASVGVLIWTLRKWIGALLGVDDGKKAGLGIEVGLGLGLRRTAGKEEVQYEQKEEEDGGRGYRKDGDGDGDEDGRGGVRGVEEWRRERALVRALERARARARAGTGMGMGMGMGTKRGKGKGKEVMTSTILEEGSSEE